MNKQPNGTWNAFRFPTKTKSLTKSSRCQQGHKYLLQEEKYPEVSNFGYFVKTK